MLLSYPLSRRTGLGESHSWLVVMLVAACSPVLFYSRVFWEHTLFAVMIAAGVLLNVVAVQHGRASLFLASGLMVGATIWVRTEGLAVVFALLLANGWTALRRRQPRGLAALLVGVGVPVMCLRVFNLTWYGYVLGLHLAAVTQGSIFSGDRVLNQLLATTGLLYGADGLFLHFPLVLVALLRGREAPSVEVRLLRRTVFLSLVFICLTAPHSGGNQWGPRYLLAVVPLAAILGVEAASCRRRFPFNKRGLALLLPGLVGFGMAVRGVWTLHDRKARDEGPGVAALRNLRPDVCVFLNPLFAQGLASMYFDRQMFFAEEHEIRELLEKVHEGGVNRFIASNYRDLPQLQSYVSEFERGARKVRLVQIGLVNAGNFPFGLWTIEDVYGEE